MSSGSSRSSRAYEAFKSGPSVRGLGIFVIVLAIVVLVLIIMDGFVVNYVVQGGSRTLPLAFSIIGIIAFIIVMVLLFYIGIQLARKKSVKQA